METADGEPIRYTIWYPALNPNGLTEAVEYVMSDNHVLRTDFGFSSDEPFTVIGHALEGAIPDMSGAPYPLVINSHAFIAQMWQMYLGEHLASYGFVVIAPEHAHDSWDNVYTDTVTRVLEITRMIDYADILTAPDGAFAGMIDTERVAVGGNSSGGVATFGAAGAPVLWTEVEGYCQTNPEAPDCVGLAGQFHDINQLLGTNAATNESVPVITDSRVDAIFPMSGTMELYGESGLATITIPAMTLFGSADPSVPWLALEHDSLASMQKAQVIFNEGGLGVFYNQCEAFPYIVKYDMFWACSDPVWDMDRAHDLINHFTTAFLLDTLKGDEAAHAALAPDAVAFPGITYQAEGF
jgi:predicted dienelactone hydrolase